jgi:hypothetical protein
MPPSPADPFPVNRGGIAAMLHAHAPGLWRTYGMPFDRLTGLGWWDFEAMCRVTEREAARGES